MTLLLLLFLSGAGDLAGDRSDQLAARRAGAAPAARCDLGVDLVKHEGCYFIYIPADPTGKVGPPM